MKVKDAPVVGHESICDPADADRAAASIRSAVYGSKRVDHMGDFNVEGGKQNLSLKAIHVSLAPLATPSGDPFEGLGQPVYFTLESECGEMADVRNCSESISSTWHFGVVFKYEGGLYFAGTPEVGVERGALVDQPVQKALSLHGHHEADGGPVDFLEIPGEAWEGEFHLSDEDAPVITGIPWMSDFGTLLGERAQLGAAMIKIDEEASSLLSASP